MVKQVEVIEEGFENVVAVLKDNIEKLEIAKQEEINVAIQPIEEKYNARLNRYKQELDRYVRIEKVEVPDEEMPESETETDNGCNSVDYEREYIGE